MSDLISRQAAIDAARDWYEGLICGSFKGLEKRLRALPSAQPERKTGRWLNINESEKWECSECGRTMWFSSRLSVKPSDYSFCPKCGALMDGEVEGRKK